REEAKIESDPLLASQIVVRVCLFLVAAIAMLGGALQFFRGRPDTSPSLDNVHRFMAGVYFSTGLISLWAAITIRQQGTLVYLLPSVSCWPAWAGWCPLARSDYPSQQRSGWATFFQNWSCR